MWSQTPQNKKNNSSRPPVPPPGTPPSKPHTQGQPPKPNHSNNNNNSFGKPTPSSAAPTSPPPNFTPNEIQGTTLKTNQNTAKSQGSNLKAVDPGAVFPCLYRYAYLWPNLGPGYWMYVTYIGKSSIAGWRYYRHRWVYYSTDLRSIRSFYCY